MSNIVIDGTPNIGNGFVFWDAHKASIANEPVTHNSYYCVRSGGFMLQVCKMPAQKFNTLDIAIEYSNDLDITSGASLTIKLMYSSAHIDTVELPLLYSGHIDIWELSTTKYTRTQDVAIDSVLVSIRNNSRAALNVRSIQINVSDDNLDMPDSMDFQTYAILYGTEAQLPVL